MNDPAGEGIALFERLAAVLAAGPAIPAGEDELLAVLADLGYFPVDEADPGETQNRIALLRAAARFSRVFQLAAPDAPGIAFFGAELSPAVIDPIYRHQPHVSASGAGASLRQAFESCIGEGVEYLSQLESAQDRLQRARIDDAIVALDPGSRTTVSAILRASADMPATIDWIEAVRLSSAQPVLLPADLCLRRLPGRGAFAPPYRLSNGCAAGRSFEAAALHGMLELVERDAASLWWRGGARGRLIALEGGALSAAATLLAQIRREKNTRRTWLLDITTDLEVPSVAAVSSRPDGRGFACGLAAGLTLRNAACSALMEMCQMELAYTVVEAKRREKGDDASLNEHDRLHLARSTSIDAASCALLHPTAPTGPAAEIVAPTPVQQLRALVDRLSSKGIETFAIDLTRPALGIPVARIVAPALQLEPSDVATERLVSMRARTGGGERHTQGLGLL